MGRGLVYQLAITPGIDCVAIAELDIPKCAGFLDRMGLSYQIVNTLGQMHQVTEAGQIALTDKGELISESSTNEVVIEASNSINEAGYYGVMALKHQKDLVLMNSEIDLIFGPYLKSLAQDNDVVCTSCDGDQYGVIKHLIDEIQLWGFELVMAGNIKGFLDRYANPTSIIPEADKRNLDYKMCVSYTDGTKLNIEMAILANAYGLVTPIVGMTGPRATNISEVFEKFNFEFLWRERQSFVDYVLGAEPGGGVFVIGYCDNPYQREMMTYYKMGDGPYYLFYRPYHLCHIEAVSSMKKAVKEGKALLKPDFGFQTNVFAYAKRDLKKGEYLDGIGGYTCYGLIENTKEIINQPGLPICLSEKVKLKQDIRKDQRILLADISYNPGRLDFELYHKAQKFSARRVECI